MHVDRAGREPRGDGNFRFSQQLLSQLELDFGPSAVFAFNYLIFILSMFVTLHRVLPPARHAGRVSRGPF